MGVFRQGRASTRSRFQTIFGAVFSTLGLQTAEPRVLGSATGSAADPLGRTVPCGGRSPLVRGWQEGGRNEEWSSFFPQLTRGVPVFGQGGWE